MRKAATGAALLGGYALGRTKSAKLAMAVAAWVIKKNVDTKKITSAIAGAGSPAMDAVSEQVRKELVTAGKEASAAAVGAWADRLADSLHERTARLQEEAPGDKDAKGTEDTKKADTETEEEPDTDKGADTDTDTDTDKPSRARARKAEKPAGRKKAAGAPAAPRGDRRGGGTKRRSGE